MLLNFPRITRTRLRRYFEKRGCPDGKSHIASCYWAGELVYKCNHAGMDDPTARGFARPNAKHKKITPRFYKMGSGSNGSVKTRKATQEELGKFTNGRGAFEYASTPLLLTERYDSIV